MTRRELWNSCWGVGFSLIVLGLPLAACNGDSGFGPEERVHFWIWHGGEPGFSSFVARGPIRVDVGEKVALYLAGAGPIGSDETVSCEDLEWTVEDTTVAGVTVRGVLSGLAPGTTVVRVRANCGSYGRPVVERGVEVSEPGSDSAANSVTFTSRTTASLSGAAPRSMIVFSWPFSTEGKGNAPGFLMHLVETDRFKGSHPLQRS